ncbi:hypothetical protein [Flavobacterium agrisoli]|uniref:Uncharacterized protein n=1 Tax=Flavobacterium agrisoli TaxID=2793066 RepID=A0A934PM68_9FLAO|nr:hypothetical protein [Flavobacterium agrisoli]MBK0369820.1 hypothetical protein [Flavobacterium agrisoli]
MYKPKRKATTTIKPMWLLIGAGSPGGLIIGPGGFGAAKKLLVDPKKNNKTNNTLYFLCFIIKKYGFF